MSSLSGAVNTRTLRSRITSSSYFTKFAGNDTTLKYTHVWLNGWRMNNSFVEVSWTTRPEVNIRYFVVERRLSNENNFSNRDSVLSKAVNGYSNTW